MGSKGVVSGVGPPSPQEHPFLLSLTLQSQLESLTQRAQKNRRTAGFSRFSTGSSFTHLSPGGIIVLMKLSVSLASQGGCSCGQASHSGSMSDPLALDTLPPIYKSKS